VASGAGSVEHVSFEDSFDAEVSAEFGDLGPADEGAPASSGGARGGRGGERGGRGGGPGGGRGGRDRRPRRD
jgi:hypothetical protein